MRRDPRLSFIAFLPALVALVLGIIGLASKAPGRGRALAGVILGPVAFVVAIVVSVSFIAGDVRSTVDDAEPTPIAVPESPSAEEEPEPEPTVEVPADIVYSGTGDSILAMKPRRPRTGRGRHPHPRRFAQLRDLLPISMPGMAQQDLIVNTIGPYQGTVLFNAGLGGDPEPLDVTADGNSTSR